MIFSFPFIGKHIYILLAI